MCVGGGGGGGSSVQAYTNSTYRNSKGPGVRIEGGVVLKDVVLHGSIVVAPWHPHDSSVAILTLIDLHFAGSVRPVCNKDQLKMMSNNHHLRLSGPM